MDVDLIATLTGLPLASIDPAPYLWKDEGIVMTARVKDEYDLNRDNKGFLISSINDFTVHFAAKVLVWKMLRNRRPNQCNVGMVSLAELCVEGVQIN